MGTCSASRPEDLSQKIMKELIDGRDSATKLRSLLHESLGEVGLVNAGELTEKILMSFDGTISLLTMRSRSKLSDHDDDVITGLEIIPEPLDHHSHCQDQCSDESGESSKKRLPAALKDRRGCYKRRKSSQSWSTIMPTIEDGQGWRKYGQKEILNAQYPRAYYRCTRKHEQNCRATKQVQQIQNDPKMYQTTYIGQHTCRNILRAPQMVVDEDSLVSNNDYNATPLASQEQELDQVLVKEEFQISEDLSDKSSFESDHLWSGFNDIELSNPSMGLLSFQDEFVAIDFCNFDEAEFSLGTQ